ISFLERHLAKYEHLRILANYRNHLTYRHVRSFDVIVIRFHQRPIQPNRLPDREVDFPLWLGGKTKLPQFANKNIAHFLRWVSLLFAISHSINAFAVVLRRNLHVQVRLRLANLTAVIGAISFWATTVVSFY